jgi:hypothetical protein
LTGDEWLEVDQILVQLIKQRRYWAWKQEEIAQGIPLSPDFFRRTSAYRGKRQQKVVVQQPEPEGVGAYAESLRYEQDENIHTAIQDAIHEAEEVSPKAC